MDITLRIPVEQIETIQSGGELVPVKDIILDEVIIDTKPVSVLASVAMLDPFYNTVIVCFEIDDVE